MHTIYPQISPPGCLFLLMFSVEAYLRGRAYSVVGGGGLIKVFHSCQVKLIVNVYIIESLNINIILS